jgi:hypothetical protein
MPAGGSVDTHEVMDDSFTLGQGAKRSGGDPAPKHVAQHRFGGTSTFERSRLIWGAVFVAAVLVTAGGFLKFMGGAGTEIGADNQKMVEQVGAAQDMQAELTADQSIHNAMQLYGESGSFADVTAGALAAAEPSFTYVSGASTDANTVGVATTEDGVGLAVKSSSGSCLYAFVQASGTTYGKGAACTGDAAMGASGDAWASG